MGLRLVMIYVYIRNYKLILSLCLLLFIVNGCLEYYVVKDFEVLFWFSENLLKLDNNNYY